MAKEEVKTEDQQQAANETKPTKKDNETANGADQPNGTEPETKADNKPDSKADAEKEKSPAVDKTNRTLTLTGYGGYNKLRLVMEEQPQPKENEVLVHVKFCGINFAELMNRQGLYKSLPKPPLVMGFECSGQVEAVGDKVTELSVGDRVICMSQYGLWRERVAVDAANVFKMPDNMTFEEGASVPVAYVTAELMLFDIGNLRPGQTVVVHMAAGGVGSAVSQLCSTVPDVTVIGTASAHKHETIKANGVTHAIDYRTEDWEEAVRRLAPDGVHLLLDPLMGKDAVKGYNLLRPLGKIVHFGASNMVSGEHRSFFKVASTWWKTNNMSPIQLSKDCRSLCGFNLMALLEHRDIIRKSLERCLQLYREGKIKPIIHGSYPFEKAGEAMHQLHSRANIGKVLLSTETPPEPPADKAQEDEEEDQGKKQEENGTADAAVANGHDEKPDEKAAQNGEEKPEDNQQENK